MRSGHLSDAALQEIADRGRPAAGAEAGHLGECPECRRAVAQYRVLAARLSTAEPPGMPRPEVLESFLLGLGSAPAPAGRTSRFGTAGWMAVAAAAAAGLVLAGPVTGFRPWEALAPGFAALAAALAGMARDLAAGFTPLSGSFARWLAAALVTVGFAAVMDAFLGRIHSAGSGPKWARRAGHFG